VLYRCDCAVFNVANNKYRRLFIALAISYSKYFFCSNHNINSMIIVLFEPGGLLDEAIIIQAILDYIVLMNYVVDIKIYIVEPYKDESGFIARAQNYFYNKFIEHARISVYYFVDVSSVKKSIKESTFDYLLFLSLDPYEYLYLQYYKDEVYDIYSISRQGHFFLDIALFAIQGFFYDVELSFVIFNKDLCSKTFLKNRLFGRNNTLTYGIKTIYSFEV
jgi:hypothetical protein